ncbi:hypothetical protein ABTN72_18755, partial [Acinetobacter baumannii]
LNRQTTSQRQGGAVSTASYDANSRLTTVVNQFNGSLVRQYDSLNRVITLTQKNGAGTIVATVVDAFDAGGRKTSELQNGLLVTYTNDAAGRLTGQT